MSAGWTIAGYSLLMVLVSLGGGAIPLWVHLTHQRMQMALSVVAGAMLGVALLHLIPHALFEVESIDTVVGWVLAGFLAMFFIERFFSFHQHDVPDEACPGDHDHHGHEHTAAQGGHRLSWGGAAVGLTLHSLADGVALAASVRAESDIGPLLIPAGMATFLVILLHKPFDAMTIGTLMAASGRTRQLRQVVNLLFALIAPLGALLFWWGAATAGDAMRPLLGAGLAFSAGTFLCIASSDLLPELQFHQHDRVKLSVALVAGLAMACALGWFESWGHDHPHGPGGHNVAPHARPDRAPSR